MILLSSYPLMWTMKNLIYLAVAILMIACKSTSELKTMGTIEKIDSGLDEIISAEAKIEVLGEGYTWSEGPIWIETEQMLLFSDVPKNTIYKWTANNGVEVYLTPSGYTGAEPSASREPGSNGLTLDGAGRLVLAQHGDRRVARMDADLKSPQAKFITLADRFDGKRLSSPNDVVVRKNGDLFFTDPPYGLPKQENDSTKEISFQGVYKVNSSGDVSLVTDSLTRPNGLAFTPDERTLIVANSDPGKAAWYAFDLTANDSIGNARIFFDATENAKAGEKGLPDGLKIDSKGNIFATGPGGIWIFNSTGKPLGKILLPQATANCALSADEKTLYMTSHMYLLRLKLRD
jgi:gluconolactonase